MLHSYTITIGVDLNAKTAEQADAMANVIAKHITRMIVKDENYKNFENELEVTVDKRMSKFDYLT
jgi:predicted lactoylglutathione lyase